MSALQITLIVIGIFAIFTLFMWLLSKAGVDIAEVIFETIFMILFFWIDGC